MALYIPHSILHLARLLYVRPETFEPDYVVAAPGSATSASLSHPPRKTIKNTIINNNYERLQDLILLFKIRMSMRKDFYEIYRQFWHTPSERFSSPVLWFLFRMTRQLHALATNAQCPTTSDCNPQRKHPSLRKLTGCTQKRQDRQCM